MELLRSQLLAVVQACLPGAGKSASLVEGAENIVFDGTAAHTYNDIVAVSVPFEAEGLVGALKAAELAKFLGKLSADTLEIEVSKSSWKIVAGKAKAEMQLIDIGGVAQHLNAAADSSLQWHQIPEDFNSALRLCQISGNRTPLRGIYVDASAMISSDGLRVNRYEFPNGATLPSFWVEDEAIKNLVGFGGLVSVAVDAAWAHFKGEDGTVFSARTKDLSGFPKEKVLGLLQLHARKDGDPAGKLPEELLASLSRAEVFGQEVSGLNAVQLHINGTALTVKASKASGSYEEELELATAIEIPLSVGMDATSLREAATKVKEFYVRSLGEGKAPVVVFQNEHYTQLAMTLKV